MENYRLEEKDSFTVVAIGVELKSDYTDYVGINQEKAQFWQQIRQDGTLAKLKAVAINEYLFTVNEAVNNKMMHYAGVMTDKEFPEATRVVQFPKSEYLVIQGEGSTTDELSQILTGIAFGQVLREATQFAYVGGPNSIVQMGQRDGLLVGEMWIPVVRT